jgi:hypothetical protein
MRLGSTTCPSRDADLTRRAKQGYIAIIPNSLGAAFLAPQRLTDSTITFVALGSPINRKSDALSFLWEHSLPAPRRGRD